MGEEKRISGRDTSSPSPMSTLALRVTQTPTGTYSSLSSTGTRASFLVPLGMLPFSFVSLELEGERASEQDLSS